MLRDSSSDTKRFVTVGRIIKSHGLNGEVLVDLYTKTSFSLLLECPVWLTPPTLAINQVSIENIEPFLGRFRVSFHEIKGIDDARSVANCTLVVRASAIPDSYFEPDEPDYELLGFSVRDDIYGDLGTLTERIETGANDVWTVSGRYGEVLIPVIDEVVIDINIDTKSIVVKLLPGLIEGEPMCE